MNAESKEPAISKAFDPTAPIHHGTCGKNILLKNISTQMAENFLAFLFKFEQFNNLQLPLIFHPSAIQVQKDALLHTEKIEPHRAIENNPHHW